RPNVKSVPANDDRGDRATVECWPAVRGYDWRRPATSAAGDRCVGGEMGPVVATVSRFVDAKTCIGVARTVGFACADIKGVARRISRIKRDPANRVSGEA